VGQSHDANTLERIFSVPRVCPAAPQAERKKDRIYIRLGGIRIPEIGLITPVNAHPPKWLRRPHPVCWGLFLELRISTLQSHSAREESAIRKIATDYSPVCRRGESVLAKLNTLSNLFARMGLRSHLPTVHRPLISKLNLTMNNLSSLHTWRVPDLENTTR
jgi:hypothetical protein